MPSIGRLRYLVKLQSPTRTTDTGGGQSISWSTITDLYADIRPKSGKESFTQDQLQEISQHEVIVRYRSDMNTSYRILYGTRIFNIRHIKNVNESDRYYVLTCEEGVAA